MRSNGATIAAGGSCVTGITGVAGVTGVADLMLVGSSFILVQQVDTRGLRSPIRTERDASVLGNAQR